MAGLPRAAGRALLVLAASTVAACGTTHVPLNYSGKWLPPTEQQTPVVSVGAFDDVRDTDPDWLGAIRGGYGNPMRKLRTQEPMSQVVSVAFAEALRARGVYAPPGTGKVELEGTIRKLDCSQYFNREAHVHLDLRLVDPATGEQLYVGTVKADETEGWGGGWTFGEVETLRVLAERALQQAVDDAFASPEFRAAIRAS